MANIVDVTYFQSGQIFIPQLSEPSQAASLQVFIDTLEHEFLEMLLGYELYNAVRTEATARITDLIEGKTYTNRLGVPDKWKGLKFADGAGKRSLIANYIYYKWLQKEISATTATGEKKINVINAMIADSVDKQCGAWNEMVNWVREMWEFLYVEQDTYPEYFNSNLKPYATKKMLFHPINSLGI